MVAATTSVPCPVGGWTEIATGATNVLVQLNGVGGLTGFRVAVAGSAPEAANVGISVSPAAQAFSAKGLGTGDNVYVYPLGNFSATAEVITS